jgi:hypothetical protein
MSTYKSLGYREFADKPVNTEVRLNKHPKRKNNEIVAAMYAMYQTGKSLAEIGAVYHKTRQAVYDVFRSRGYPLRSKQFKGLQTIDGIRFTETKGGYLRGTHPDGRRMMLHHYVWEKANGPIPPKFVVRIVNGDRRDARIENLELMSLSEWNKRFSPHLNQFTSPTGSRKTRTSLRDRIRAERDARWARALDI